MNNGILGYGERQGGTQRRPTSQAFGAGAGQGYDPTLYHVLIIGQSNGNGADAVLPAGYAAGSPALSVAPYCRAGAGLPDRFMLNPGVRAGGNSAAAQAAALGNQAGGATGTVLAESLYSSLVPVYESADGATGTSHAETLAWGLSHRLGTYGISTVVSAVCGDGLEYAALRKGGTGAYYANSLLCVRAAYELARRAGRPYRVLCLVAMHGEADQALARVNYAANLATWRSDYERDIRAITGRCDTLPLYFSQMVSAGPDAAGAFAGGYSNALQMWLANKADPARLVLLGARYHLGARMSDGSCVHINPWAMRRHGEEFGLAIYRHQFLKRNGPLRPVAPVPGRVNRSGTTVTADFYGSSPLTLAFDYVGRVASPLFGFTYYDDSGSPPTVTAVTQTGPYSLSLTLSGTPSGTPGSEALRYAFGTNVNSSYLNQNIRGNLRDTAGDPSYDGSPLYQFGAIFHEAVT